MQIGNLLKTITYFQNIPLDDLQAYADKAELIRVSCGSTLMEQGKSGQYAYILLDGRLRTTRRSDDQKETVIGEISRGEIVGETAILLEQARTATVKAVRDSLLMQIDKNDLLGLIQKQQDSLLSFTRTTLERSQPSYAFKEHIHSVLLFPLNPDLPLEDFAHKLNQKLSGYKKSLLLDQKTFTAKTGCHFENDTPETLATAAEKIAQIGSETSMLVFLSSGKWDAWTRFCVNRADKVIFIANAGDDPAPGPAEQALTAEMQKANHASVELVLFQSSADKLPQNTRHWLAHRQVKRHYHVVPDQTDGVQKVARFLTGNAIGLALSGGGFKSAMQAGILHAMREGGIPLDIMGGSSGGAVAGARFASRPDLSTVPEIIQTGIQNFNKAAKYTLPLVSLFSGKAFTRGFQNMFGDTRIEDLWDSYFCLSLSLVSGDIIIHQTGEVWEAVRASSSVMGLFPPVIKDKDCLVDGGFINPCPTNLLQQMGAGKIVVVSAFGKAGIEIQDEFSPSASGWGILRRKLNPFKKEKIVPSLGTSIVQSMLQASSHLLDDIFAKSKVDLFIEPDLSAYKAQDQSAVKKLYELGYRYGCDHLNEWKHTLALN